MLFHVEMEITIPHDLDAAVVADLKAREKAVAQEYQRQGHWLHVWRVVGRYANISVFDVDSCDQLHELLQSLPLYPYMEITVRPLCHHGSSIASPRN